MGDDESVLSGSGLGLFEGREKGNGGIATHFPLAAGERGKRLGGSVGHGPNGFEVYITSIDRLLRDTVSDSLLPELPELVEGGKRIRALLSLLCCEAVCGDHRPALPLAASYELAHAAALVQDDMIDGARERRGTAAAYVKYGPTRAMLQADWLLFKTYSVLSQYRRYGVSKSQLCDVLRLAGLTAMATTRGEILDLDLSMGDPTAKVPLQSYVKMVRYKTGALLAGPAAGGALVGGAPAQIVRLFYEIGEELGVAYQIRDDILDIFGDPTTTGKPIFNDIANRKRNILVHHVMREGSVQDRNSIGRLLGKETITDEEKLAARQTLIRLGSREFAEREADKHERIADRLIEFVAREPTRSRLRKLTSLLARRME